MLSLIGTELVKQVRRARTWVALGFVVFVPILMTVILKLNPPSPGPGGDGQFRSFFLGSLHTGLLVPATSLFLMSRIFLVIVMALFVGDAVASEAAWGNLRFMLVRPVTRGRLLAAKLVSAVLLASAAVLLVALTGLVVGVIAFGWHPFDVVRGAGFGGGVPPGFGGFREVTRLSQSEGVLLWHTLLAVVLIAWGLAGVLAFGFMLSTMTDSPVGASFGAVGFFIVMGILDTIDSLGSIRHGLPVDYYDAWTDLFMRNRWTADMTRSVLLQIPYVIVFIGIAWWWFHRKDITS